MRRITNLLAVLAMLGPCATAAHATAPDIVNGPTGRTALDGIWTVRLDAADRGVSRGFPSGNFTGRGVQVPWVFNGAQVSGARGLRSFQGNVGWYRTTFTVASPHRYAIRFESVNHRADVWIDGVHRATHLGTYLPFEARAKLFPGRVHSVVVRVDWRDPKAMKAAGFHRTWFNFGGINRTVSIRPVGPSELIAPTLTTRLRGTTAVVSLATLVRNDSRRTRTIAVTGSLVHGSQTVAFALSAPPVPHGAQRRLRTTVVVPQAALWAPGTPNLYDLTLSAGDGESGWHSRVGLRELSWSGGRLRLNGRPLTLRGASLQEDARGRGDALGPADQNLVVASLNWLGANATRSQHPLDEGLIERLDAVGILLWQGVGPVDAPGSWTSVTPALQARARDRVRVTVRQDQLHPSVIAWNLANEVGANGHAGGQAAFITGAARELHARDPGRMVAVDVWGKRPPAALGPLYSAVDAVGVTNYAGWYEDPLAPQSRIAVLVRAKAGEFRRIFAGKVLAISEFGAEANARNPSGRPGGYAFQARLMRTHIDYYRRDPGLDGFFVWNLRDFAVSPAFAGGSISRLVPGIRLVRGVNQKGLISWSGKPKPAAAAVAGLLHSATAAARGRGGL